MTHRRAADNNASLRTNETDVVSNIAPPSLFKKITHPPSREEIKYHTRHHHSPIVRNDGVVRVLAGIGFDRKVSIEVFAARHD